VDIDQEAIGKAKKGLYTLSQIGEVPSFLRDRYFSKRQDKWQINEIIAKMVSFKHLDLLSAPALPKSDLILCRNLLIYFDREQQVNLIKFLHGILKKRGFLILGKSEILLGKRKEGFGTFNSKERIYKKI
jgi:chemotaxis protein methyltransferase CheR